MASYRFKSFVLNVSERQLFNDGGVVPLTPKVFDTLVYLIERAGHLAEKDEIMGAVWSDSIVEEGNLTRSIHTLRKALGHDDNGNKFIETVPTKGYRFIARVEKQTKSVSHEATLDERIEKLNEQLSIATEVPNGAVDWLPETGPASLWQRRPVLFIATASIAIASIAGLFLSGGTASSGFKALSPQTRNGEAYTHYKEGKLLIERRQKGDIQKALESFEKAIELDANYAAAYVGKADAVSTLFMRSNSHDDIIQARAAVKKAIELDESNSYAHTLLCRIRGTYDWEFVDAVPECQRAVELDPNDYVAYKELGFALNVLGREEEALAAMNKAVVLAPSSHNKRSLGLVLYHSRRYDEAIAQFQQVEETDPSYDEAARWLIRAYAMKDDYSRALERYLRQMELDGDGRKQIGAVIAAFDKNGWPGVLRFMTHPPGVEEPQKNNMFLAGSLAQLGETDKAFEMLDKMYQSHAIMLITIAREPTLDPLRGDPRFDELLRKMKLK